MYQALSFLAQKALWAFLVAAVWAAQWVRPADRWASRWLLHYLMGSGEDLTLPEELLPEMAAVLRRTYRRKAWGRGNGTFLVESSDYSEDFNGVDYMDVVQVTYKMVGGFTATYQKVGRALKVRAQDTYDWHSPQVGSCAQALTQHGLEYLALHPVLHREFWYSFRVPAVFAFPLALFGLAWKEGEVWMASEAIFSLAGGKEFVTSWEQEVTV